MFVTYGIPSLFELLRICNYDIFQRITMSSNSIISACSARLLLFRQIKTLIFFGSALTVLYTHPSDFNTIQIYSIILYNIFTFVIYLVT